MPLTAAAMWLRTDLKLGRPKCWSSGGKYVPPMTGFKSGVNQTLIGHPPCPTVAYSKQPFILSLTENMIYDLMITLKFHWHNIILPHCEVKSHHCRQKKMKFSMSEWLTVINGRPLWPQLHSAMCDLRSSLSAALIFSRTGLNTFPVVATVKAWNSLPSSIHQHYHCWL